MERVNRCYMKRSKLKYECLHTKQVWGMKNLVHAERGGWGRSEWRWAGEHANFQRRFCLQAAFKLNDNNYLTIYKSLHMFRAFWLRERIRAFVYITYAVCIWVSKLPWGEEMSDLWGHLWLAECWFPYQYAIPCGNHGAATWSCSAAFHWFQGHTCCSKLRHTHPGLPAALGPCKLNKVLMDLHL